MTEKESYLYLIDTIYFSRLEYSVLQKVMQASANKALGSNTRPTYRDHLLGLDRYVSTKTRTSLKSSAFVALKGPV